VSPLIEKKEPLLLVAEELGQDMPVEANALDKLAAEELFLLITQLPTGYRTVFNLYAIEGLKHAEIAKELGITEGTSKSQLNKARMMLQQLLAAKTVRQMDNEKPNNPLAEKLDGMNSFPEGIGFSATRVWDQLENQLQDKKRQPMRWLRYAAAIVLLAGAAILWIMQRETAAPKEIFTKQSKEQSPINTPTSIPSKAAIIATTPYKIQEAKTIHQQQVLVFENHWPPII